MVLIMELWTWLKEHIDNPDRRIGVASLILSSIGVVLSLLTRRFPETPELIIFRDLVIVFGLIALVLFFATRYIRRGITIIEQEKLNEESSQQRIQLIEESNRILSSQFKNCYNMVHKCKNELFEQYYKPSNRGILTEDEYDFLHRVCHHITYLASISFREYFRSKGIDIQDDIGITVKLIFSPDELVHHPAIHFLREKKERIQTPTQLVITFYRDHYTYQNRSERKIGTVYEIGNNTAFDTIYRRIVPYYLSNDLQSLGYKYVNRNKDWKEHYNATLVLPIGYDAEIVPFGSATRPSPEHYKCYGFLTVDSLNSQRRELYNNEECRYILSHAADLLAIYLLTLAIDQAGETKV